MGPRCSSAETQVCHRSYIIAASLNAPTSLLVLHCYLIIHLISVIVFTTINNKLKNQDTHIRWDYRKTDDFVHILSNDDKLQHIDGQLLK